jgi:predicted phosphodiesterase
VLLGAVAAVALLGPASSTSGEVGPGRVAVQARFDTQGRTILALPPLGLISAHTHSPPVTLEARVDQVDVDRLQTVFAGHRPDGLLRDQVEVDLEPLLQRMGLRAGIVALLVGAVAGAVIPHRRWTTVVAGSAGALVVVTLLLGSTWQSFDPAAFDDNPRFEGPLERAPAVLAAVRKEFGDLDDVRTRLAMLSTRVTDLYAAAAGAESSHGARDEVRILHIADVHLNPVGLEMAAQLARDFDVDAVLDTGDLTSFGLEAEARFAELLGTFDVPYLFVPGNHDSAEARAALAAHPAVTFLDGEIATVGDVTILGVGDPSFTADNVIDTDAANRMKLDQAPRVASLVRRTEPDVLAVHDVRQADSSMGRVPLVVAGHTHKRSAEYVDDTLVLEVGSMGATGLGSFMVKADRPYEAQVLRFRQGQLLALDYVSLRGLGGSFRVDRQVVAHPEPPGSDQLVLE